MRILVNLSDLQAGLAKISPAIPPKSTLPILEHFLMVVDNLNNLFLTATDQDIIIRTHIDVLESEEGAVLVPFRIFNDIIKTLGNKAEVVLEIDLNTFVITIIRADFKADIPGLDAQEYIDLPILDDSKFNKDENFVANLSTDELQRIASKTHFAVSTDEFRLAMTGVLMQFKGSVINAVATDSFRLVRLANFGVGEVYRNELDVIVPIDLINILKKVESNAVVYVYKNSQDIATQIRFDFEKTTYISRLINEKFPPYEIVIPKNNEIIAIVDKSELLNITKRVSIFADPLTKKIKLRFEGSNLFISGEDQNRGLKANEQMFCNFNGEVFEISFNHKFLEEAISNIETDTSNEIYMTFSDGNKPALIKPDIAGEKLLMLIMPIRMDS